MSGIAIIGKYPFIDRSIEESAEDLFAATGNNTGNLLFALAAHGQIEGEKTYYDWDFDPAILNAEHRCAVLVCANMVNPEIDLTELTDRIERLEIPLCAFSLGLQAPLYETRPTLNATIERFLRVAAGKASSVGVRGPVTGGILDRLGIRNWRIVGCPSNFLNTETNFEGYDWAEAAARSAGEIGVHIDDVDRFPAYVAQCRRLVGAAPHLFFVQSPIGKVQRIVEAQTGVPPARPVQQAWLAHFGASDPVEAEYLLVETFRCFFSAEEWIIATSRLRLSFGARLHGNILAVQCGVPALVVAHDERTRELAECLGIPYVTLHDFLALRSLSEVTHAAVAGMGNYSTTRQALASEFVTLLQENGLAPSMGLRNIAACAQPDIAPRPLATAPASDRSVAPPSAQAG